MMTDYPNTCRFCGVPYRVYSADEGTQSPDSHYHAMVAENARLKALTEWRPIETAPKDGDPIIICGFSGDDWDFAVAFWHDDPNTCITCGYNSNTPNWHLCLTLGEFFDDFEPTHWLPLPEPPEVTK